MNRLTTPEAINQEPTLQTSTTTEILNDTDRNLARWGGLSALAGAIMFLGTVAVVVGLGLPDASDVATLKQFDEIRTGRIAEHFLYLGALVLFALHVVVLHRVLHPAHPVAALFATTIAAIGLAIMATSSLLHISTSPLHELYSDSGATASDQNAIEYAWYGAQSLFDTMLATGVFLVPIGIVLFSIAMFKSTHFGSVLSTVAMILGVVGVVGATISVVEPGSMYSAGSVLAIVLFHLLTGWRTFKLATR